MTTLASVRDRLERLVAFDTTSRLSNLALVDWAERELAPFAAAMTRIPNAAGDKANLWVRIGPDAPGGLVLSGHTDVVPVDGQPWTSDPWTLTERDGRLHGRGTCDMKGFLALAMAFAPAFAAARLARPVHFAFSYDEEVGCAGVGGMIEAIAAAGAAPAAVWVGEPTLWGVVSAHKGIRSHVVTVTGREAHSSDPRKGASAIHEAVTLMAELRRIALELERGPASPDVEPGYPTLTIGRVEGGTAVNILARVCSFAFDFRATPETDVDAALAPFLALAAEIDARLKAVGPECGVAVERRSDSPPLRAEPGGAAERLVRELTGDNARRAAAYAAEAGLFQRAGFSSVICGPGSIDQAHQPDEWVAVGELDRGCALFSRLVRRLEAAGP
jgi:acetylornithine deacetylase